MCGIAGLLSNKYASPHLVEAMLKKMAHRGPDDRSLFQDKTYVAGMNRLSINDLVTGNQPLTDASGSISVFYNGEIYNSPELRRQLLSDGYRLKSNSDGEVISHLYLKYGDKFFSKLCGMFSIALWDSRKRILILGRDFSGEKPLYYSQLSNGAGFLFSSDLNSLVSSNLVSSELSTQAVWDFPTFLWVPEPSTIYSNILAVPPASYLTVSLDGSDVSLKSYRDQLPRPCLDTSSYESVVESVRHVVYSNIKSQLLSDVPIGSFLSSGLDSSIISTIASKHTEELTTFCIGFEDQHDPYHGRADESLLASEYAEILGTNHRTIKVTSQDFRNLLPSFSNSVGQPYAVSSGLGILAISKVAKSSGIKVLLSGDGADEAFGGYSWYNYLHKICTSMPVSGDLSRFQDLINSDSGIQGACSVVNSFKSAQRAWSAHYYASESEKSLLFSHEFVAESSLRHFNTFDFNHPIDFLQHDRAFYFPNEMLSKIDRMTMASSVEGRAPFASHEVQLLAEQIPFSFLVRSGKLKSPLRDAFSDILPNSVKSRPKHGFNVPIDNWLRGEWFDLLEHTFSNSSALYNKGLIDSESFVNAKSMLFDHNKLCGHVLFCYIMLNIWLEQNAP